jgi:hypothetical protein
MKYKYYGTIYNKKENQPEILAREIGKFTIVAKDYIDAREKVREYCKEHQLIYEDMTFQASDGPNIIRIYIRNTIEV